MVVTRQISTRHWNQFAKNRDGSTKLFPTQVSNSRPSEFFRSGSSEKRTIRARIISRCLVFFLLNERKQNVYSTLEFILSSRICLSSCWARKGKILSDFTNVRKSYSWSIFPRLLSKLFVIFLHWEGGEGGSGNFNYYDFKESFFLSLDSIDDGLHVFNGWLPSSRRLPPFRPTQFIPVYLIHMHILTPTWKQ